MKTTERVITKTALPLIALAGILLIVLMVQSARSKATENNAYIRVINCIVSYKANTRTQDDIEHCYVTVEKQLHTKLERYDNSKN